MDKEAYKESIIKRVQTDRHREKGIHRDIRKIKRERVIEAYKE